MSSAESDEDDNDSPSSAESDWSSQSDLSNALDDYIYGATYPHSLQVWPLTPSALTIENVTTRPIPVDDPTNEPSNVPATVNVALLHTYTHALQHMGESSIEQQSDHLANGSDVLSRTNCVVAVFHFLNEYDLLHACSLVSKRWRHVANSDPVWKPLYKKRESSSITETDASARRRFRQQHRFYSNIHRWPSSYTFTPIKHDSPHPLAHDPTRQIYSTLIDLPVLNVKMSYIAEHLSLASAYRKCIHSSYRDEPIGISHVVSCDFCNFSDTIGTPRQEQFLHICRLCDRTACVDHADMLNFTVHHRRCSNESGLHNPVNPEPGCGIPICILCSGPRPQITCDHNHARAAALRHTTIAAGPQHVACYEYVYVPIPDVETWQLVEDIHCPQCVNRSNLPTITEHPRDYKQDPDTRRAPRDPQSNRIIRKKLFPGYYRRDDPPAELARTLCHLAPERIPRRTIGPVQPREAYEEPIGYDYDFHFPVFRIDGPPPPWTPPMNFRRLP